MPHRWDDHEHRWGERVRANTSVHITGPMMVAVNGRLRNVSLSGALIMAEVSLPLNSVVFVGLIAQTPAQIAAVIMAQITRKIHGNIGVEWCEFAPHAVKHLLRSTSGRKNAP